MATTIEEQKAFLQRWAADINAQLDAKLSPKAQFTLLAVYVMGWVGGDDDWCRTWSECFGEVYPYRPRKLPLRPRHSSTASTKSSSRVVYTPSESTSEWTQFEGNTFDEKFAQLVIARDWNRKESTTRRTQAIEDDINSEYGTDLTKLEEWQRLCDDIGIRPAPPSIKKCKKALRGVLVNLVDLVNYRHHDIPVQQFLTYKAFREYTRNGKIFSKKAAKKDGFIKILLREVFPSGKAKPIREV